MLNRLKLENFKAWREADLAFGKVTGFFGSNSAGKSSLLHLLLLLKQTRNATDRGIVLDFGGPGHMVNLGSFEDAVYKHDKSQAIGWVLDWTLPGTLAIHDPLEPSTTALFEGNGVQTRCEVGLRNKRLWPRELEYRFADTRFWLQPKAGSKEIRTGDRCVGVLVRAQPGPSVAVAFAGQELHVPERSQELLSELGLPR